ncbi:MAG: GTPase ObgE [Thermodesulfobacteriota bacterium]
MKFVDQATIWVKSGQGGHGCVSFRREKFVPKGGPDGGDGGRGGHIILAASSSKDTLLRFHFNQHFQAESGKPGEGGNRHGADGADLIIKIPPGTEVYQADTNERLADLDKPGLTFQAAQGGRGGRGNARFATPANRAPRRVEPGQPGQELRLRFELKLLADVGLIGLPNVGKSSIISKLSAARPKIADYPFTTLAPNLGVAAVDEERSFVLADVPGLIPGASRGAGLGHRFLKHVQRCRVLLHVLDAGAVAAEDPLSDWKAINAELAAFDPDLARKKQVIGLNKMDLPGSAQALQSLRRAKSGLTILAFSALTGQGLKELKMFLWDLIQEDQPSGHDLPEGKVI